MKRIMLGNIRFLKSDIPVSDLLTSFVEKTVPEGAVGFTLQQIRQRLKLIDKIEAAKAESFVDLEDADWDVLKQVMAHAQFTVVDKGAIELVDRVLKAQAPPKPGAEKPAPPAQ